MGVFFLELLLYYKLSQESSEVYIIHQILIQHILVFSFLLEKSSMDGVYVIFILVEHHLSFFLYFYILEELCFMVHPFISKYLVFRNYSSLLLNGYSIYGLCLTFWTNEFLGSYSNYKFIISFSIFNRMRFWRILCSQSNIEEVFLSFIFCSHFFFVVLQFFIFFIFIFYLLIILRNSTNNKIPFFPFIFLKDFFGFILILCLYFLQTHFAVSSLSPPDNALEACALLTPLHIVPEWYFLCQYAMLKAVPNKNAGFIILLTSILAFFFFGEIRNLTALCLLNNNSFSLSFFFLSSLSFLWIGAQFPQEKFLSYARILTLYYYFLLMCLLLSKKKKKKKKKILWVDTRTVRERKKKKKKK